MVLTHIHWDIIAFVLAFCKGAVTCAGMQFILIGKFNYISGVRSWQDESFLYFIYHYYEVAEMGITLNVLAAGVLTFVLDHLDHRPELQEDIVGVLGANNEHVFLYRRILTSDRLIHVN